MQNFKATITEALKKFAQERDVQQTKTILSENLHNYFLNDGLELLSILVEKSLNDRLCQLETKELTTDSPDLGGFLSILETCTFLKIKRTTLYKHTKDLKGFPQPSRVGRRLLYSKDLLSEYLKNNSPKKYRRL